MMEMKCMIIEDELPAVEILRQYLEEIPDWHLVKVCGNAMEAIEYLRAHTVDILFVDIEMPRISGMEMLQSLQAPPLTIITSAYSEYGVKAYDLNVFDYLLKPYSLARLLKTYQRVLDYKSTGQGEPAEIQNSPSITVKEKGLSKRIDVGDILFIESQRSYLTIRTDKQTIRTKMTLAAIEDLLPASDFVRVHRSFIISISKVESFNARDVFIADWKVPIGRNYKYIVSDRLNDEN